MSALYSPFAVTGLNIIINCARTVCPYLRAILLSTAFFPPLLFPFRSVRTNVSNHFSISYLLARFDLDLRSILEKGIDRMNRINYLWIIASLEMNEVFKIDFQRKIREEIDRENFEMKIIVVLR